MNFNKLVLFLEKNFVKLFDIYQNFFKIQIICDDVLQQWRIRRGGFTNSPLPVNKPDEANIDIRWY